MKWSTSPAACPERQPWCSIIGVPAGRRPPDEAQRGLVEHVLDVLHDADVEVGELDVEVLRDVVEDMGAEYVRVIAGRIARPGHG